MLAEKDLDELRLGREGNGANICPCSMLIPLQGGKHLWLVGLALGTVPNGIITMIHGGHDVTERGHGTMVMEHRENTIRLSTNSMSGIIVSCGCKGIPF